MNNISFLHFVYFAAMSSCCVPQCRNPDGRHRFPTKDRELRKYWIATVKRDRSSEVSNTGMVVLVISGCTMYGIQLILPVHFRSSELPVNKLKRPCQFDKNLF